MLRYIWNVWCTMIRFWQYLWHFWHLSLILRPVLVCFCNISFLSWIKAFLFRTQMSPGDRIGLKNSLLLLLEKFKDNFFSRSNCFTLLSVLPSRRICCNDHSFPPEEKDWLFRYSNIPAMHNDGYSLPSLFLAQQRVCTSKDCLWWVPINICMPINMEGKLYHIGDVADGMQK